MSQILVTVVVGMPERFANADFDSWRALKY
jgi:hypothetical protein